MAQDAPAAIARNDPLFGPPNRLLVNQFDGGLRLRLKGTLISKRSTYYYVNSCSLTWYSMIVCSNLGPLIARSLGT